MIPIQPDFPVGPPKLSWFRRHKKLTIIVSIILGVLLIGGGVAAYVLLSQKPPEAVVVQPEPEPQPEPEAPKFYSPLTGMEVKDQAATTQAATAIMIENSPDSRPQSGLKDSGVVFEAIAEGGITRFLVLYQQQKPKLVGPVRSVRMYYVDWLAPFNASIAHVGGSRSALNEVRNGKYRDIDQFFNAGTYWRATDRYAPHNVYTSFKNIDALNKSKGYKGSSVKGFLRADTEKAETPTATRINVKISSPLYDSHYKYDAKTNTYDRWQAGEPHKDREAGQISPRVVIVMKIAEKRVFEDGWREQLDTIGEGSAYIFQDGTVQEVKWYKQSRTDQIVFLDKNKKEVPLARGQTWLTAIPDGYGGGVSWR